MERVKTAPRLKKGFEEIRAFISAKTAAFGENTAEQKAQRRQQALIDLRFFGETYLPHYLTALPSAMHKEMFKNFQAAIEVLGSAAAGGDTLFKQALAAPRGNAKSTVASLVLPLWCIFTQCRKFIGILSDTTEQANEFLEFIKAELEANERLREDFPEICGMGRTWKSGHIITANGVKVRCWGTGKGLRGARHGSYRPDLIICDDLENDENVSSPEQRRKTEDWFFKAVMKIGNRNTLYVVVGTILHYGRNGNDCMHGDRRPETGCVKRIVFLKSIGEKCWQTPKFSGPKRRITTTS